MCVDLEGLDKGPEQDADGLSLPQQLDEAGCTEQPQEAKVDEVVLHSRHDVATQTESERERESGTEIDTETERRREEEKEGMGET